MVKETGIIRQLRSGVNKWKVSKTRGSRVIKELRRNTKCEEKHRKKFYFSKDESKTLVKICTKNQNKYQKIIYKDNFW